jgi:hypothetical protein
VRLRTSKVGWGIDDVTRRACCYARDIKRTRGDGAEGRPRSRGDACFASAVDDEHGSTLVFHLIFYKLSLTFCAVLNVDQFARFMRFVYYVLFAP